MSFITVKRVRSNANETISDVYVDGIHVCEGLEDEYREVKVKGETRIPAGTYPLKVRKHGGFHERYLKKFPKTHEGMIEVCNVPGFTDILIHVGNYDEDTMGCLLIGKGNVTATGYTLTASTLTYEMFYKKVIRRIANGGCEITYIDMDRGAK